MRGVVRALALAVVAAAIPGQVRADTAAEGRAPSTPGAPEHAALAVTTPAVPATAYPPAAASKKDAYLAAKRVAAEQPAVKRAPPRLGVAPTPVISIFNTWTHEWIAIDPTAPLPAQPVVDRFLRCHYTNQPTGMDRRLIGTLVRAARHFSVGRVDIVSGFRHPKYNLMLRKKGREVARDSQHTQGTAVDFRLPGIRTDALEAWARSQRMGGVGLYLESGFVHVDTGPVRTWGGR